jgi:D-inositol-3-phosphate glycosyltransferase
MHTSPLAQPGSDDAGGMNVYVRELATGLARSGVRCEVYTRSDRPGGLTTIDVEPGLRAHYVPAGPHRPVPKHRLPALVDEWAGGVAGALASLSARGQGVDVVHAHYWLSAAAGHRLKHALGLPLVSTFHTLEQVKAQAGEAEPAVSRARREGERSAIGCSDAIVASSTVEAGQLVDLYGAEPDRVEVVAPGVDHAFFSPGRRDQARRAAGLPAEVPIVLFVGRVQPLKGLTVAVQAVARAHGDAARAHLVVIGGPSGPQGEAEMARVSQAVQRHGLSARVHFVDPQRHERLSTYYRAADVCLVPSRSESFGLVALEAAACGVPVVASAVGGLTTLVEDGRTGYLVAADDVGGFAEHLSKVVNDPALGHRLGAAGHQLSSKFTWVATAARVSALASALTRQELVTCA